MTRDHAAALRVIDFSAIDGGSRMLCENALPEFAALYRAALAYRMERKAGNQDALDAALAAVADALTKGKG